MKKLVLIALLLSGCTGVRQMDVNMTAVKPNWCKVTEARASSLSTIVFVNCRDEGGNLMPLVSAGGLPAMRVPLEVLRATAPVAASIIFGGYLRGAAEAVGTIKVKGSGVIQHEPTPETIELIQQQAAPLLPLIPVP